MVKKIFLVIIIAFGWALSPCAQGQTVTSLPDSPTIAAPSPNASGSGSGNGFFMDRDPSEPARFQAAFNYSWMRFEATTTNKFNLNGLDTSFTYFYRGIGIEGQIIGGFGANNAKLGFAGGGFHYRFRDTSALQPWVHVIAGYTHFYPQTPYGAVTSFGWETGGGFDYRLNSWLYGRVGANVFGTRLYQTNQVSPQVFGGFVVNF
jgi:hypothetical protein